MDTDITPLLNWIKANVPGLLKSGENWKVTLHGRNDGNVNAVVEAHSQVMSLKQQRLDERSQVRPVRTPV